MMFETGELQFLMLESLSWTNGKMSLHKAFGITNDYISNITAEEVTSDLDKLNSAVCGACDLLDIPIGE